MTVTRHPMFVNADSRLGGLPADGRLAERLRESFELLPREAVSRRFVELLVVGRCEAPLRRPDLDARLACALDDSVAAMIAGLDAPADAWRKLRRLGAELRRHGFGPADSSRLVGTLIAALVDVAAHRWRMETIIEWAEAVSLLFESALTGPRPADQPREPPFEDVRGIADVPDQ